MKNLPVLKHAFILVTLATVVVAWEVFYRFYLLIYKILKFWGHGEMGVLFVQQSSQVIFFAITLPLLAASVLTANGLKRAAWHYSNVAKLQYYILAGVIALWGVALMSPLTSF